MFDKPPYADEREADEEILEEAEFYVAQGLWDAARGTLQDALNAPAPDGTCEDLGHGDSIGHLTAALQPTGPASGSVSPTGGRRSP